MIKYLLLLLIINVLYSEGAIANIYIESDTAIKEHNYFKAEQILTEQFKASAKTETAYRLGKILYETGIPEKINRGIKLLKAAKKYKHKGAAKYINYINSATRLKSIKSNFKSKDTKLTAENHINRLAMGKRIRAMESSTDTGIMNIVKTGNFKGVRANIYIDTYSNEVAEILRIKKIINRKKPLIDVKVYLKSPGWNSMTKKYIDIMTTYNDVVLDIEGRYSQSKKIVRFPTAIKLSEKNNRKVNVNEILNDVISVADKSGISYN